jgi:predicted PurR-regulated permease PerM
MNTKKYIKYLAAFFISFFVTAIYRPQVEIINKHWVNGSFTIEEPYLTILLMFFLIIIPVGLIGALQYIQLLKQELKDIEDDLYVEGVLDELAMEMGEYDEDDEY